MTPLPLSSQLAKIAKAWKYDPLRHTYQMETFLTSLAAHPKLTPEAVRAAQALRDDVAQKKVCLLRSFDHFRFTSVVDIPPIQWPVSAKLTHPASMPEHYDRLLEGMEKSVKGIGRPWWKVFFGVW
jgi:hypothetical protein